MTDYLPFFAELLKYNCFALNVLGKDGKLRSPTQLQRKRSRLGSGVRKSDFDKAKLERESILKKCKANNEKFTDEEFPPKPKSLFFNGKKPMNTSLQYSDQA